MTSLSASMSSVLACALLFAACSDAGPAHEPTGKSRVLPFEITAGAWPEANDEVVRVVEMPTEVGAIDGPVWTSSKPSATCVEMTYPNGTKANIIALAQGAGDVRLQIPLTPDAPKFDQIRVALTAEGFARIGAFIRKGNQHILRSEFAETDKAEVPRTFDLDLDELPYTKTQPDILELMFQGVSRPAQLHSVELRRRPPAARLAGPDAWPAHVSIGNAYRPCHSLLPGIELSSSWSHDPAAPAQDLEVDLGPTLDSKSIDAAKVSFALAIGGEVVEERSVKVSSDWSTVTIPLGEWTDRDGERRLTVSCDAEHGAYVSAPRLTDPRTTEAEGARTVVLITSDTHRADHVGYAPNGVDVKTPTIDALAARGTRFLDAWSVTSITNPSHASILTGQPMKNTGVLGNLVVLSDRAKLIAEHYQDQGFRTFASVSARHLLPTRSGFGQGFERFNGPRITMTLDGKETIAAALEMLDDAKGEDVFMWLHLFDVHAPYRPHDEFIDEYYEGDPFAERAQKMAPKAVAVWNRRIRDAQYILALYKNEVSYLDDLLAQFFEKAPRVESGVIALTADHGESHGENGIYWKHSAIYPSTLYVPLVLAGPGVPAGDVIERPVANLDIARTLIDLTTGGGDEIPGTSLLAGASETPRFTIAPNGMAAGVSLGGWYLLLHLRDNPWGQVKRPNRHAVELYDLTNDRGATKNLAAEHPDRVQRMWPALVEWLANPPEDGVLAGDVTTSDDAKADIAALGYMADAESKVDGALMDANCDCKQCQALRANQ